ncbi:MAG: hypothetical protein HY644_02965 [Acidobacteria bacterium]|nr:hypothetical protein [Acidobacteriota bacterium]
MKKYNRKVAVRMLCLLCFLLAFGAILAQQPARGPLAGLKRALAEAGAPALTSDQEQQLTALITARRDALRAQAPSAALQTAQRAYQNAILNGDNSAAQAQADTIANETANLTRTRLKDTAKFKIDVLNVLKSNDNQVGLLLNRIGSAGLSRLLESLAGPGGLGPGMGGIRPRGDFDVRVQ